MDSATEWILLLQVVGVAASLVAIWMATMTILARLQRRQENDHASPLFGSRTGWGGPDGAHGWRMTDGTYFAVWQCQNGHRAVGDPDRPPWGECVAGCSWAPDADLTDWSRCTEGEALEFIGQLERSYGHGALYSLTVPLVS